MTDMQYHIAQINIAQIIAPIDSDIMAGFVARLDEINALADGADGFVWRLQTDDGDATALRPYEDDRIIVNMSVWENIDALFQFTYATDHVELLRQRKDWFTHMKEAFMCMWWIPAGTPATVDEAKMRLAHLDKHGPTPYAFTFKKRFTIEDLLAYTINE